MAMTASYDRTESWRLCCLKILGYDDTIEQANDEYDACESDEMAPFLNLLPVDFFNDGGDDDSTANMDPWMATSEQLASNIAEMKSFLHSKKDTFAVSMSDQEASLVQTTLTSFTAQTAVELERLHSTASSRHRIGMTQIFMAMLKEEIADPFARLAKLRSESSTVPLYQKPLQCRVIEPQDDGSILGTLEDQLAQRFAPTRPTHRLHQDFWDSYAPTPVRAVKKPKSWVQAMVQSAKNSKADNEDVDNAELLGLEDDDDIPSGTYEARPIQNPQQPSKTTQETEPWTSSADTLQQESMMLQQQMAQHNELDSIHQVESAMVTITQLMGQFADLVSEQHENVFVIHDNVDNAAKAVESGREALVDAKHKTASSHHYMAKGITAMAILLLLFHYIHS